MKENSEYKIIDNKLVKYLGKKISNNENSNKVVIIPEGVEIIGEDAFYLADISKVILPKSIKIIEEGAFQLCFNLTEINIPYNLIKIGSGAFIETKIKKMILSNDNMELEGSFLDCHDLEEIELSNKFIIRPETFEYCTALKEINIPKTTKLVEPGAFNHCSNLNIKVPYDLIDKFGIDAFKGCNSLTTDYNGKYQKYKYNELLNID